MRWTVLIGLAGMIAAAGCAQAGPLPAWKLDELTDLDGFGPPATEGDRAFRPALAGKTARLTVPTWWGRANRPPEDAVYLLKVSYKDTATTPVVFLAHSGVGGYQRPTEVHRFGGRADGKWKTAQVPLSWDLVMRRIGDADVTELFLRAEKDLPVESIAVAEALHGGALAAARARYERETREWVARVQAPKRAKADAGPRQKPLIPPKLDKLPLVPFARTYMTEIYPNSAPQKGEAGRALRLRVARNEYETAMFGVYANGKDLDDLTVRVVAPTGDDGAPLACQIDVRAAEYAVVGAGKGKYRLFPQRLWPAWPVDVPDGRSQMFHLTVKTLGKAARPGPYKGRVMLKAEGTPTVVIGLEVEVVDAMLPTMQECGLDLGACMSMVPLQDLATLAEFNHTGMHVWFGGTQPRMKVADGKLHLDWYYLDDWMTHAARKLDMTHIFWFMGGDPYGFPDTLNLERDLYRALEGDVHVGRRKFLKKTNAAPEKVLPELRPLVVDFVRQLAVHAGRAGWPGKLVIHPFDEPAKWVQSHKWDNPYHPVIGAGKWIKPHFEDCCALIRQGAKGHDNILTGGDIHHAKPGMVFLDDIDVFCTNAIHEDPGLGDKVRAADTAFWQYGGCNDQAPAHRGRFTFGWYFAAYDSRGSLIWA